MNRHSWSVLLAAVVGVVALVSCPMPTMTPDQGVVTVDPEPVEPKVEIDAARGVAVYVTETGERFDLVADEPDGSRVACTDPFALIPAPAETAPAAGPAAAALTIATPPIRGIVIGRRFDGSPGIWVVHYDGTITGASVDDAFTTGMPACRDRGGLLLGSRGWIYHLSGWATDGTVTIVTGWAEHPSGFRFGRWSLDPGTTVGVYWRIWRKPYFAHVMVSPARVIGTPDPTRPWPPRPRWPRWMDWHARMRFFNLRLFLRGWYDTYLSMVDDNGTSWNALRGLFEVTGLDQDDQPAIATIDLAGAITITPRSSDKPDLEVTAVVAPLTPVRVQDTWLVRVTVRNNGTTDVSDASLAFRASADATLDAADPVIGTLSSGPIAGGASVDISLPSASISAPGTHWVFAVADPANALAESDEGNNTGSATVAVKYPRLIIDTYAPTTGPGAVDTFLSLFTTAGDPTLDANPDLWNNNQSPYTVDGGVAVAENDDPAPGLSFARIDYNLPAEGLAPGVYYLRARGRTSAQIGPYAIRALLSPDENYAAWRFAAYNNPDSYENDDNPKSGGVPNRPVTLGLGLPGRLNRYLTAADVDWFVLTLP